MNVQSAQQVQELLGISALVVITERVDDVALLTGQMVKMGFVEVLDWHIPRHWKQRGLSWGWTAVIWLAYILTEGDHLHRSSYVDAVVSGKMGSCLNRDSPSAKGFDTVWRCSRLASLATARQC